MSAACRSADAGGSTAQHRDQEEESEGEGKANVRAAGSYRRVHGDARVGAAEEEGWFGELGRRPVA